jgi:hypothetical protein
MSDRSAEAEFEVLLARTGMQLTPAQKQSVFEGYPHLQALLARIGTPRGIEAEPAVIFVPEAE